MKTVITDAVTVSANDLDLTVFEEFGELVCYDITYPDELAERIKDADIVLCNKTVIGKEVMESAKKLKYIGLFATGYNNIDTESAARLGITVCNAGQYSTMAVAQHTFAFILSFASRVDTYSRFVADEGWINSKFFSNFAFPTSELYGKTLGIVGYGSIGRAVGNIARAFGMRVLIYTRTPKDDGGEYTDLDTLLGSSDYVSVHLPLNAQSKDMFNADTFAKFKRGAYFINTSRGGTVVERDLADALEKGVIAGAALDVLCAEPMVKECPLLGARNVIITPHIAWAPLDTRIRLLGVVRENIRAWIAGKPVNKVN